MQLRDVRVRGLLRRAERFQNDDRPLSAARSPVRTGVTGRIGDHRVPPGDLRGESVRCPSLSRNAAGCGCSQDGARNIAGDIALQRGDVGVGFREEGRPTQRQAHDGTADRTRLGCHPTCLIMHRREQEHRGAAHVAEEDVTRHLAEESDALRESTARDHAFETTLLVAAAEDMQAPAIQLGTDERVDRERRSLPSDQPTGEHRDAVIDVRRARGHVGQARVGLDDRRRSQCAEMRLYLRVLRDHETGAACGRIPAEGAEGASDDGAGELGDRAAHTQPPR